MTTDPLLNEFVFRNGRKARNRVWLAPLTNIQSHPDGLLSDAEKHWLERRASGGFGVLETCAAYVAPEGKGWSGQLGIDRDECLDGLTKLATSLREKGAVSLVQLYHGGVRAPAKVIGTTPWGPSAIEEGTTGFEKARAGTEEDIQKTIETFRSAALRAQQAGFDGVEIHGAHGYVLSQFLSSVLNRRTDDWGGSYANRARFLRETLRAVRGAVRKDFVVGVRISPENMGYVKGLDLDESLQLAPWLAEDGADFLHLSLWAVEKNAQKYPDQHPLPLFRAALPKEVPIIVAGNMWTTADAHAMLNKGADGIALGRAAIANPDWPSSIADTTWQPKRPPLTPAELADRAVSPVFVEYLRNFKGFVSP